jgi:hypothetical protein
VGETGLEKELELSFEDIKLAILLDTQVEDSGEQSTHFSGSGKTSRLEI